MRHAGLILFTCGVSLGLHLLLGWQVTVLAGVMAGLRQVRSGWFYGAAGVGLAWLLLVGYNLIVAPEAVASMFTVMGGLTGNIPGALVGLMTVLTGLILGALGGGIGTRLALISGRERSA